jgi:small-conductance mechanosensitive channel
MSVTASSLPPNENQEIIDFLRRLASMLSGGRNAEMLQEAASVIEALMSRATAAEQAYQAQQDHQNRNRELREAAELASHNLTTDIASLTAQLAESERRAESERAASAEEKRRLQAALEETEALLAKASAEVEELRNPATAIDHSIAIVPVSSLQLARAQFDFLTAGFARNGDVISQTICQIGACAIDKALSGNEPPPKEAP